MSNSFKIKTFDSNLKLTNHRRQFESDNNTVYENFRHSLDHIINPKKLTLTQKKAICKPGFINNVLKPLNKSVKRQTETATTAIPLYTGIIGSVKEKFGDAAILTISTGNSVEFRGIKCDANIKQYAENLAISLITVAEAMYTEI